MHISTTITLIGLDFIDSHNLVINPHEKALNVSNFKPVEMALEGTGYKQTSVDPDNFRLQVADKYMSMPTPSVTLKNISTKSNTYILSDNGTSREGNKQWRSKFLRLVANSADQNALSEKTPLVALGDTIEITYQGAQTVTRKIQVGRPMSVLADQIDNDSKCQLKHDIREVKVRFHVISNSNNQQIVDSSTLKDIVKAANEILAQATMRINNNYLVQPIGSVAITEAIYVNVDFRTFSDLGA